MSWVTSFLRITVLLFAMASSELVAQQLQVPHSLPLGVGAPEVAASLARSLEAMALPGLSLAEGPTLSSPGGTHRHFQVRYAGKPVVGAHWVVHWSATGKPRPMRGHLPQGLPAGNAVWPHDTGSTRMQLARLTPDSLLELQACWLPQPAEGLWHPAFAAVTLSASRQRYGRWYLHAQTGQLLLHEDLATYCHLPDTATGLVYLPDPLSTANQSYGGAYADNSNAANAQLDAERQPVQFVCENLGSQWRLEGSFVRIADLAPPTASPITSPNGQFNFNRSQAGFEEVNAYYHIDTYQRYVQSLGFNTLVNYPLQVDAHGYTADQSAFFPLSGTNSYILLGDGGVDDAEDADVIVHEYGHAISHSAAPGTNTGYERRGLDEGLGDYLQASYHQALTPNRWELTFGWDGHNTFWSGRLTNLTLDYPTALATATSFYDLGAFWASTLMELHGLLGRSIMDRLVLQQLFMNTANMNLSDAAQQLLEADTLLYAGANTPALKQVLCARQLLSAQACTVGRSPLAQAPNSLEMWPNPAGNTLNISGPVGLCRVRVHDASGRELWQHSLQLPGQLSLPPHLPAGLYLLEAHPQGGTFWRGRLAYQPGL